MNSEAMKGRQSLETRLANLQACRAQLLNLAGRPTPHLDVARELAHVNGRIRDLRVALGVK